MPLHKFQQFKMVCIQSTSTQLDKECSPYTHTCTLALCWYLHRRCCVIVGWALGLIVAPARGGGVIDLLPVGNINISSSSYSGNNGWLLQVCATVVWMEWCDCDCAEQDAMMDFFNNQINQAGMSTGEGNAIISCQVNLDKNFAFLEVSWLCASASVTTVVNS